MSKTPQEKKQLSYQKDRRNVYGQNNKGSRKVVKFNKQTVNRQNRRAVTLAIEIDKLSEDMEKTLKLKPKTWKKVPDMPLGQYLELQKEKLEGIISLNVKKGKK